MKLTTLALSLAAMLALAGMTGCKHAEPAAGSSPATAANAQAEAASDTAPLANDAQTQNSDDPQTDSQNSEDAQTDSQNSDKSREQKNREYFEAHFNPSYTARPVKEAFYNQVELKLDGKFTHAATAAAVITDVQKQTCANNVCGSTIHFEDESIQTIPVRDALDLELTNLGDLNGDGNDELGAIPKWWSSVWQAYHIFIYQNHIWYELFIPPIDVNIEYLAEHPYIPVEKSKTPGKVIIRELNPDSLELEETELDIPEMFMDYAKEQREPATN